MNHEEEPKTKKLFPIKRHRVKTDYIRGDAFERKPVFQQAFGEWDDAADFIVNLLEKAFYEKMIPEVGSRLPDQEMPPYKPVNQCAICYMKTMCKNGPLPWPGRCDFCPGRTEIEEGGEEEEEVVPR